MSMNASRNTTAAIRRAASAAEEWDLSPTNLNELEAQARRERRMNEDTHSAFARYVSASGLGKLVQPAVEWFEYKAETQLPHNLVYSEMSGSVGVVGAYGRKLELCEANAEIERFARFGGWLRAAAELPALRKVITKTQSARGINSPYTVIDLWDFAKRYPSPGALERKLWKVRRRADAIFRAFEGQNASWASIAQGLMTSQQVGKAAVVAVAISLSGDSYIRGYGRAREWLTDYHLCKVADNSDGVEARREETPRLSKLGVDVYRIAIPRRTRRGRQVGVDFQWLVRTADGRTYHSQWGGPNEALHDALRAWKDQDRLTQMDADLVGFLKGEMGFCPLVIREDSFNAGNCSAGTESWLRERGWNDREFIPATWLIPHLDYGLVRNVAMGLYRRHTEQRSVA